MSNFYTNMDVTFYDQYGEQHFFERKTLASEEQKFKQVKGKDEYGNEFTIYRGGG